MDGIYLLLGTNLGDRAANLAHCKNNITHQIGDITRMSSIYESDAWGITDQPGFLNQVIGVETILSPMQLLDAIGNIEDELGRIRKRKWGERIIDIDILYFHDKVVATKRLKIPHPQIQHRRFTLAPLAEIIPQSIHPVLQKSQQALLEACVDDLTVRRLL